MGNLSDNIDNRDVAPQNMDFDPLPPGRYKAEITNSEVKTTQKGGLMLKCEWAILAVGYEGRKVWGQFNIVNASDKAQAIGRGQLSALAKACGKVGIPEDSSELHGIPHLIKLAIEASPGYPDKNVVKGYYSLDSKMPAIEDKKMPEKMGNVEVTSIDEDSLPF